MPRVLRVRCARCGELLFVYLKVGEGRLWRCWKRRILRDYTVREGEEVRCPRCGGLVGVDKGAFINLKQSAVRVAR